MKLFVVEAKNEREEIRQWFSTGAAGRQKPVPYLPSLSLGQLSRFAPCVQQGLGGTQLLQLHVDQKVTF